MEDTRRTARLRRRLLVRFGRTACFTLDVGLGGFRARLLRVLPLRARVEGSIQVEGRELPFTGQVAWAEHGDFRLQLPGTMGVRFTLAPAELLAFLGDEIEAPQRLLGT